MSIGMTKQAIKLMKQGGQHWKVKASPVRARKNYQRGKLEFALDSNEAKNLWAKTGSNYVYLYMAAMTRLQRDEMAYGIDTLELFVVKSITSLITEMEATAKRAKALYDEAMDGMGVMQGVEYIAPTEFTVKSSVPAVGAIVRFTICYDRYVSQLTAMHNMVIIDKDSMEAEVEMWKRDFERLKKRMNKLLKAMGKKGTTTRAMMRKLEARYVSGIIDMSDDEAVAQAEIVREARKQNAKERQALGVKKHNSGTKKDVPAVKSKKILDIRPSTPDNTAEEAISGQDSIQQMVQQLTAE